MVRVTGKDMTIIKETSCEGCGSRLGFTRSEVTEKDGLVNEL